MSRVKPVEITQSELKDFFCYEKETGNLYCRISRGQAKKGAKVGGINGKGYLMIKFKRKLYQLHRFIWLYFYGEWPKNQIDHINGDPLDNRIENLRDVDGYENHKNVKKPINNTSGIMGVSWNKKAKRWRAYIRDNKQVHLGQFNNYFDACCARKSAEVKYGYHSNHGRSA